MRFPTNFCFASFVIFLVAAAQSIGLAQTVPERSQPIILFDGSSTAGWTNRDGSANEGWIIQDGTLHRSKKAGDLYFNMWFDNFELTFEWKLEKGGNSGVKYRVKDYGKQSLGCEFQCQDDTTSDKQSAGGLYALYAPDKEARRLKPAGQWNRGKIIVCGRKIEHWLNGELMVRTIVGSQDWLDRVAESKFKDKTNFGQNQWGRIFLQDHGNPVWFRKITLTPLVCNGQFDVVVPRASQLNMNPVVESLVPYNSYVPDATIDR